MPKSVFNTKPRFRARALDDKLELIARIAETVLELLHHRRSLRVE